MISISLKRCFRCKLELPLTAFGKNRTKKDGLQEECNSCRSIQRTLKPNYKPVHRIERKEGRKCCAICKEWLPLTKQFFGKQTGNLDGLANVCKPCKAEMDRQYRKTENGKIARQKERENLLNRYPEKIQARTEVNLAIRRKKLPPAKNCLCLKCGNIASEYHHYLGYKLSHWLDVIPLCYKCHDEIDSKVITA